MLLRPPAYISIEPVNYCNLACPECPTGNGTMQRPAHRIDVGSALALMQSLKDSLMHINFYFQGEPFMHQQLHLLIAEAARLRIPAEVSTNGHFMSRDYAEAIVKAGLPSLIVSFDGFSQESYSQYRRKGEFAKVLQTMQDIADAKKKLHSRYPVVCAQVLVLSSTENNLDEIKQQAYRHGADRVSFKTAQFYDLAARSELLPRNAKSRYSASASGYAHRGKPRNRCWRAWSNPVVCSDGTVVPCCYDKNAVFALGSIDSASSFHRWTGGKRLDFLSLIMRARDNIEMCQNCPEGRSFFI